ncbi:uncharacterized protein SOCE26_003160 [Sorangium cellulosum]|uniref:Uncharacterized protein n=1 Tax=Sorangium cellulosum TaxID=56 RepID=A0A2L0EI31_SORCE|nr:uncharacterized protein SOCE26_003160 [Sorangium cellulosum]
MNIQKIVDAPAPDGAALQDRDARAPRGAGR